MARILIIGCGARGRELAGALAQDGHAIRGTTRTQEGGQGLRAAGIEPWVGDPDRLGSLVYALDGVTVLVHLLGSARGTPDQLAALHGDRLWALLEKTVDTTVRGVVYESSGIVAADVLAGGTALVRRARDTWEIPVAFIDADPGSHETWLGAARAAVGELLATRSRRESAPRYTRSRSEIHKTRYGLGETVSDYSKDVLVGGDWLAEHLDDDNIRIVEVDENRELYAQAHIPGAVGFDWQADLQDQVQRNFLGPEEFGKLLGDNGISNDHLVVLYGDRNNWFAAYTYWYLKYYGHDNVKLLNGPREKWIDDGRPTSTDVPSHPATTFTTKPGNENIRAYRDEVNDALGTDRPLVDVRSPAEFAGEIIAPPGYEQEGAQRGGHIPGAKSIPWSQAVAEDGTFKSREELEELYGSKDVLTGEPIIAYCRIGERSAHTWFVLHELLGRDDVKNYDGSWTEWGNLVGVPIEK